MKRLGNDVIVAGMIVGAIAIGIFVNYNGISFFKPKAPTMVRMTIKSYHPICDNFLGSGYGISSMLIAKWERTDENWAQQDKDVMNARRALLRQLGITEGEAERCPYDSLGFNHSQVRDEVIQDDL